MSTVVTARIARADSGALRYRRHQPEKTLPYQAAVQIALGMDAQVPRSTWMCESGLARFVEP